MSSADPVTDGLDAGAVRAVPRLVEARLPGPQQPVAGAAAERLGEQVVEERRRGPAPRRRRGAPRAGRPRPSDRAGPGGRAAASASANAAIASGGRNRWTVARNAIGGGSAAASRSSSSGVRCSTRARNRGEALRRVAADEVRGGSTRGEVAAAARRRAHRGRGARPVPGRVAPPARARAPRPRRSRVVPGAEVRGRSASRGRR